MKTLFYKLVEIITEMITGLDHSNLKLWDLAEYITTAGDVTKWLNAIFAIVVGIIVLSIINSMIDWVKN